MLQGLNKLLAQANIPKERLAGWVAEINATREEYPMGYPASDDLIMPQRAIEVGDVGGWGVGVVPSVLFVTSRATG